MKTRKYIKSGKPRKETIPRTIEGLALRYGKPGMTFLSRQPDKNLTSLANAYKKSIVTQRVIVVYYTDDVPRTEKYTSVTILL